MDLQLSADEKEVEDILNSISQGNKMVCRVTNHSPDHQTKSWLYYFHLTASDGKVYYWPETFRDYQAPRVFNDIKNKLGDSALLDLDRNEELQPFFDNPTSNVIPFTFGARI